LILGGLFLVLDEEGTVRGHRSSYQEIFATQDLDKVLYFASEESVRDLAEHIVPHSPGHGSVTNLVTGHAEMLGRAQSRMGKQIPQRRHGR
jgi:hypothetical protein